MANNFWPDASLEPMFGGTYIDAHPTRYNWRGDVEQLARSWVEYFGIGNCWANTYVNHPPNWWRDHTSIDFWGEDRGSPIAFERGQEIVNYIFNDPNAPWIEWIIWQGYWWVDDGMGWRIYPDFDLASDAQHLNHVHVTFY